MIKIVNGNLLDSSAKYICHQVNCQGVMGSGVAKQIKEKWPTVFQRYRGLCSKYSDDKMSLLGSALFVSIDGETSVVNLFGQFGYGIDRAHTNMDALRRALTKVAEHAAVGETIAMPYRIGCGLAGGDWGEVMDMLSEIFANHHLTLYKYGG